LRLKGVLLVLLSMVSALAVLPLIPMAHAANWSANPTYTGNCLLGYYAQSSGFGQANGGVQYAAAANCDGAGTLKTEAFGALGATAHSEANATFVDSQSFSVPNDGQTYTSLSISATYFVLGFFYSNGLSGFRYETYGVEL